MPDPSSNDPAQTPKPIPSASGPGGKLGGIVQAEGIFQLALAIPVGCFIGILLGSWLDRHFHQHWMAVTGLFLGAAGGFIQIFTTLARVTKGGDR